MEALRYPIGRCHISEEITAADIKKWIATIEQFPKELKKLVVNLNKNQLDTPYRPDGWTVRQVIHHCYDSHHNSYIRFKWTLTEDTPLIKAYNEADWAELFDTVSGPIELALNALQALHAKWVYLLKGLTENDLAKEFIHPETNEHVSLAKNIGIYAWHCEHHYAHIYQLLKRNNWLT